MELLKIPGAKFLKNCVRIQYKASVQIIPSLSSHFLNELRVVRLTSMSFLYLDFAMQTNILEEHFVCMETENSELNLCRKGIKGLQVFYVNIRLHIGGMPWTFDFRSVS